MPATSHREELYRTLFDSIDLGCCLIEVIFDEKGTAVDYEFLEVNRGFARQTGLEIAPGMRVRQFAPKTEERWFEIYGAVARTGKPNRFTHEAKALGRWFDEYAYRLGGADSRKVAVLFTDITDRLNAERALRESEARFRDLFSSMDEGFCVVEVLFDAGARPADLLFLSVNPAFEKQSRLTGAEGKRLLELVPEADDFWFRTYAEVSRSGQPARFTREEKTIGRVFDIYAAPFGAKDSRQVAVTFSDVTDRIRANAALDAMVRERTRELTAANGELESFCYSVSHDLRTPLRGIAGFTSLLEKELGRAAGPAAKQHFERVRAATARMASIIDSLLDLARVNRGELSVEDVDLSVLAREIAAEFDKSRAERAVEWRIEPGLKARGDPKMLRLALQKLLDNAWKFTQRRGDARIEFGFGEHENRRAYFVRDNGAGFEMAYYGKLFQPFERLHCADEFPGTGIGLATVQRVVRRHGGEVWADAAPGRGAAFYFTLP